MKEIKVLHLASFNGNIGDNANHYGFYKHFHNISEFDFVVTELEIREFYWKKRVFDEAFVQLVDTYDLLIVGGGNYFELWVDDSPTGTSIAIELELLKRIKTPIFFNALGVDSGQGAEEKNLKKFRAFLDVLIDRNDFISIRNDGAQNTIIEYVGAQYLEHIIKTPDAGFFVDAGEVNKYYQDKKYIAINVANDMEDVRFSNISYEEFIMEIKRFIDCFLNKFPSFEIVFVPHIFRDISCVNDILKKLDDDIRRQKVSVAPLLHGRDSFKEIMGIYAHSELVLATRFHANVCSIGLDVPTVGLVNYIQINELYKDIGSENYVDVTQKLFHVPLFTHVSQMLESSRTTNHAIRKNVKKEYLVFLDKLSFWLGSRI